MAVKTKPNTPAKTEYIPKGGIKIATSNLFLTTDLPLSAQTTFNLLFEDMIATEMVGYLKHNMVNGQNVNNQIFTNLAALSNQNNPFNIIKLTNTSLDYANSFGYSIESFVPSVGYGTNGEIVYVDTTNNNIVINCINVGENERIEVEFLNYDSLKNATIYS